MITLRHALLLIFTCVTIFLGVNGNFTLHPSLTQDDISCKDECQFFPENQTIVIINITNPKQAVKGVAYYTTPIRMKDPAKRTVASFNTTFTFREEPQSYNPSATTDQIPMRGDGFTFMMSNSSTWTKDVAGRFGIFSIEPHDNSRVVAVEYDSWSSNDTDPGLRQEEHVGLDVASAISNMSCFNYVYSTLGLVFWHRSVFHSWIEYDGTTKNLQVRVANTSARPLKPLVNCTYDLYDAVDEKMWIGFSGAHGDAWSVYYIFNWTFTSFGISEEFSSAKSNVSVGRVVGICGGVLLGVVVAVVVSVCVFRRQKRASEESVWGHERLVEMAGMPEFISYKHLSVATKQFSDQSKLGQGGFGSVYKGVLPTTGAQVAVKKVSNDSRQGEREFLAEVQIISQLRHRNIVELIGFCRDKGKFLLVYKLMPRGSLDQALFRPKSSEQVLTWGKRWKIVSGTAAALHYLHEGWQQQVIHRDVKSSNIMLDEDHNPKLGDFGLARLVDHEKNAATTLVAGTYGYIAPEATGGKFTDKTDVYAFGAVCLEIACGRKAYDGGVDDYDDLVLVECVWRRMNQGEFLSVADPLLRDQFDVEQMSTVLKLGLLCSYPDPALRPSMRQVVQVLAGDADVPDVPEVNPRASSKALQTPQFSIDDLMSARSGGKSPVPDVGRSSTASSSSEPNSKSSFSTTMALLPRLRRQRSRVCNSEASSAKLCGQEQTQTAMCGISVSGQVLTGIRNEEEHAGSSRVHGPRQC